MSTDKHNYLTLFYHSFDGFLADMKTVFPEDKRMIERYENVQLDMLKSWDIYKIPEYIVIYIKPYEEQIEKRDESFFMSMDADNSNEQDFLYIIQKIKRSCRDGTLSKESRLRTFKYFEALLIFAEKVLGDVGRLEGTLEKMQEFIES